MNLVGIAQKTGLPSASLESLLTGTVPIAVASKVKCSASILQDFVDGKTAMSFAGVIGCSTAALPELRAALGREGAIGLLLGLCVKIE